MKRPLACFGFSFFGVLLCLNLVDNTAFSVSLAGVSAVLFVLSLIIRKSRQSVFLPLILSAVISGCLLMFISANSYNSMLLNTGENVTVKAVVTESPEFSRENVRYYCTVRVKELNGKAVNTKMRISFSETQDEIDSSEFEIGNGLTFTATVYETGADDSKIRRYYKSRGIYLGAYSLRNFICEECAVRPFGYYIDLLRDTVTENLLHDFDSEVSALLIALITGDKSYMSDKMYGSFIKAGIVHIMAVSGLHLSVWVGFLSLFIDFRGKKGRFLSAVMILFVLFMMNFAYFTGSVKRAGAMTLLYFIGRIFGKATDPLNSLGFAGICALAVNPFGISDISFLLSFLATAGIILMGVPLAQKLTSRFLTDRKRTEKFLSPLVAAFAISVSVSIFTFPVAVFCFSGFSLLSALSNMLIVFAVSPLLIITGIYSFVRFIPVLSVPSGIVMKYLSAYIESVAELVGDISFSYVSIDRDELTVIFTGAFVIFLVGAVVYRFDILVHKFLTVTAFSVFLLGVLISFTADCDRAQMRVYGEEMGNCTVVYCAGRGVIADFDGDSYGVDRLTDELNSLGVKIDCAIQRKTALTPEQKRLYHNLGTEKILTDNNTSVVLFDKITVSKTDKGTVVSCENIKTDIFTYKTLQEREKCDIINEMTFESSEKDGVTVLSSDRGEGYELTVKGKDIILRGENIWQSLMKKVSKVT